MPNIKVSQVTLSTDLEALVNQVNGASWDARNDMARYDARSLRAYLTREGTVFLACHENGRGQPVLLGTASARMQLKPYAGEQWLYIDEVDVCSDQRRKGAGRAMMQKLMAIAQANGCEEVWLGADADNAPANALYQSLGPDDVTSVTGYTFETD